MNPSDIRTITALKANAAELMDELEANRRPLVITQNGEARAVLQDVASFEEQRQTMALLKLLALGRAEIAREELVPVREAFKRVRRARR